MGRPRKKIEKSLDAMLEEGDDVEKYLVSQTPAGEWRSVVTLKKEMTDDIKGIADRLGIAYQAAIKMLLDEALRARKREG